jgi:E3 ubiquitin-protein ligase ZNF598
MLILVPVTWFEFFIETQLMATQQQKDDNLCVICAEPIVWKAVGSCNHALCHICSLRMRALYKKQGAINLITRMPNV